MGLQRGSAAHHRIGAVDRRHQRQLQATLAHLARPARLGRRTAAVRQQAARAGQVGEPEARQPELAAQGAQHAPALPGMARQLAAGASELVVAGQAGQGGVDLRQ